MPSDRRVDQQAKLTAAGATAESDHGVNKSLYAVDPDGLEFGVPSVPKAGRTLGKAEEVEAIIRRLDLVAELARFEGGVEPRFGSARP